MPGRPSAHAHSLGNGRDERSSITRLLLIAGVVSGPLFVATFMILGATFAGYEPLRHSISALALGEHGWVQTANFVVTGLLTMALAVGAKRSLAQSNGPHWGPLLVGVWGASLLGAAAFATDPERGYPPDGPGPLADISTEGLIHTAFAVIGFPALFAASIVFARWFYAHGQPGMAGVSALAGVVFIIAVAFSTVTLGSDGDMGDYGGLFQRISVITGAMWLSVLGAWLLSARQADATARESGVAE